MQLLSRCSVLAPVFLIFILGGCGGRGSANKPAATISGRVFIDGKPLPAGILVVHPKGPEADASTEIGEDGSYALNLPFSGEATVTVSTAHLNPDKSQIAMEKREKMDTENADPNKMMQSKMDPAEFKKMKTERDKWSKMYNKSTTANASKYRAIPKKYANAKESPLRIVIKGGPQVEDFKLTGS